MKSIPSKTSRAGRGSPQKRGSPTTTNKRGRRVGQLSQQIDLPAFFRWLQEDGLLSLKDCKDLTGISASVISRLISTEPDRPVPMRVCAADGCTMTIGARNKDEYCCRACRTKQRLPEKPPGICADQHCRRALGHRNTTGYCSDHKPPRPKVT